MDVALTPRPELLVAVRRQVRAPLALLVVLGSFLGLSALYIGWFGTRWGLLLLIPAVGLVLAALALADRVRRGRTALAAAPSSRRTDLSCGSTRTAWRPPAASCWTGRTRRRRGQLSMSLPLISYRSQARSTSISSVRWLISYRSQARSTSISSARWLISYRSQARSTSISSR